MFFLRFLFHASNILLETKNNLLHTIGPFISILFRLICCSSSPLSISLPFSLYLCLVYEWIFFLQIISHSRHFKNKYRLQQWRLLRTGHSTTFFFIHLKPTQEHLIPSSWFILKYKYVYVHHNDCTTRLCRVKWAWTEETNNEICLNGFDLLWLNPNNFSALAHYQVIFRWKCLLPQHSKI